MYRRMQTAYQAILHERSTAARTQGVDARGVLDIHELQTVYAATSASLSTRLDLNR